MYYGFRLFRCGLKKRNILSVTPTEFAPGVLYYIRFSKYEEGPVNHNEQPEL